MKVRDVTKMLEKDGWYFGSDAWQSSPTQVSEQRFEAGGPEAMKKYLIVVEETATGFSAYSPDLDGCVATGRTREEVESEMGEAIAFHVEGMQRNGEPVPKPRTYSHYVEVPVGD